VTRSLVEQYGLPPEKVMRVNGGCNTPAPREADPGRFANKNILFVGLQWELKGGPQLVEAYRRVRGRVPGATLTIVGSSPKLRESGVQVVGWVAPERIPDYLSRASCFCLPSRREAFGIAYIEAMRAGLPVIATNLGAAPDFVTDGQTGYLVHQDDVDGMARRLTELLTDPAKCQLMGQRGRALVESEYTWERTQKAMWKAIREVLPRS
jgi:glycosyltransferase involved in cell wall biosynthesis